VEPEDEIELGLRFFESRISQDARLRVKRWHRLTDHGGYDVTISGNTKEIGTSLSDEFLADLPNTKPYQEALNDYIG